jgi:hypothetical protein
MRQNFYPNPDFLPGQLVASCLSLSQAPTPNCNLEEEWCLGLSGTEHDYLCLTDGQTIAQKNSS